MPGRGPREKGKVEKGWAKVGLDVFQIRVMLMCLAIDTVQ